MTIEFKQSDQKKFNRFSDTTVNNNSVYVTGLIMVKNQEKHILDAVKSLFTVCDHVVVVDTGSTDKTVEIVRAEYPDVQLERENWIENYALMRNKTLKYVKKGWIFVLDADESIISDLSYNNLHSFLEYLDKKYPDENVSCTIRTKLSKSYSVFARKRAIFRKKADIRYIGLVHEELVSLKKRLLTIDTNIDVLNYGVYADEVKKFDKKERYSKLLLKQMKLDPHNPRWIVMVSPYCAKHNIFPKKFYVSELRRFIFKNRNDDYKDNNINKSKYLKYLLVRYFFVLHESKNIDLALPCIEYAKKCFPYDANILTLYSRLKLEIRDAEDEYFFGQELQRLQFMNRNPELVHEESQGTEDAMDLIMVRLLMNMRQYDKARQLLSHITNPLDVEELQPELNLFKIKRTK